MCFIHWCPRVCGVPASDVPASVVPCHLCAHVLLQIWCGTEPSRDTRPLIVYDPNSFRKQHEFPDLHEWVNVILAANKKVCVLTVCACVV